MRGLVGRESGSESVSHGSPALPHTFVVVSASAELKKKKKKNLACLHSIHPCLSRALGERRCNLLLSCENLVEEGGDEQGVNEWCLFNPSF